MNKSFKKLSLAIFALSLIAVVGIVFYTQTTNESSSQKTIVHIFYTKDNNRATMPVDFLEEYVVDNNITLKRYDVWNEPESKTIFDEFVKRNNIEDAALPMVVFGDNVFLGYFSDFTTGEEIRSSIEKCNGRCGDDIEKIDNATVVKRETATCPVEPVEDDVEDVVCYYCSEFMFIENIHRQ